MGDTTTHTTIGGIFRNGKVGLTEAPPQDAQKATVLVTFLDDGDTIYAVPVDGERQPDSAAFLLDVDDEEADDGRR